MKNKTFYIYCLLVLTGVLAASVYPVFMGVRVVLDMIRNGTVRAGDYPKYVIPYTPISLALIAGVLLMPLLMKGFKKRSVAAASVLSLAVFFLSELLLESQVLVSTPYSVIASDSSVIPLESWQMAMCAVYIPPEGYRVETWTAVNTLIGDYSPAFKLHFYLISVVLILSVLNVFYGFGRMILTGDRSRRKSLILQAAASAMFLGMCIFACFTAFFRTGTIRVSALSAALMAGFFLLFGLCAGIYVASFLIGRRRLLSVVLPCILSSLVTLLMYFGEMILLSGSLYRLGSGFFFEPMGPLVLAPADVGIILLSGLLCRLCLWLIQGRKKEVSG
ncbi:MAG: hypothetical protein ACI3XR_09515 [Eubacteriales bacterium]